MKTKDIAVIVPIYNEQGNITILYNRLVASLSEISTSYQIIYINDGSKDNSLEEIIELTHKDKNVYYINFTRNFGHQIAVSAGLKYCNAECTVIIDADLQDPPEIIPELHAKYKDGYDVVYAQRKKRKGGAYFKKLGAKVFYRLIKRLVAFEIPLDAGDYRLLSKKVVDKLNTMPEKSKFIRGQIAWLGYKSINVLYNRDPRIHGKSGYSYAKLMRLAFDGITGFSNKPLIFVSRLGFIISLVSFAIIVFALFSYFFLERPITGWTSLIISVTFIGGIQLLSVGVIGEYISKINENVKQRPLFVIDATNIEKETEEDIN